MSTLTEENSKIWELEEEIRREMEFDLMPVFFEKEKLEVLANAVRAWPELLTPKVISFLKNCKQEEKLEIFGDVISCKLIYLEEVLKFMEFDGIELNYKNFLEYISK